MVEGSITIGAFTIKDHSKSLMSKKTPNAIAFEISCNQTHNLFLFKHTGFLVLHAMSAGR